MSASLEIIERTMLEFKDLQKSMLIAREEGAVRTYASLKERYLTLKTLLETAGVNLVAIDIICER